MKNVILGIGTILGIGLIYFLLTQNISTIKNNKDNMFANYFKTKEMIDVYSEYLPNCIELNVILKKDLKDLKIKRYEAFELNYYVRNNKKCIDNLNKFYSKIHTDINFNPDKTKMEILKKDNVIKKELIKKGFY